MPDRGGDVVGAERTRQPIRVPGDPSPGDVDLLQLDPRVPRIAPVTRRIDRPELGTHHSRFEAIEVSVAGGVLTEVVGIDVPARDRIFANAPWQVIVSVDQRRGSEDPLRAGQINVAGW